MELSRQTSTGRFFLPSVADSQLNNCALSASCLWTNVPFVCLDSNRQADTRRFAFPTGTLDHMIDNCRMCFRFTNVGKDRICVRCKNREDRKVPTRVKITREENRLKLTSDASGRILSKEDWHYIKYHVDQFYSGISSDEIDLQNKEITQFQETHKRGGPGFIYLMKSSNGYYKLGRAKDVSVRQDGHTRDYPLVITVVHSFFVKDYVKAETSILRMFSDKKLQGELFQLDESDVKFITDINDEIAQRMF